jgi:2-keto-4-pentenoate hydratase/2-oxohepta-3-ene-1,7-dioic acid hydratase in catechol pathway
MRYLTFFLILIAVICLSCSVCRSFNSSAQAPKPANFNCLGAREGDGQLLPLELKPKHIYGLGLTYAAHLKETGSKFNRDTPPPVFKKAPISLNQSGEPVKIPGRQALIDCADSIEAGLGKKIAKKFNTLPSLLDYEGELAFILLEDIDWSKIRDLSYSPKLGYFLANDISARTIAILGEGRPDIYDYWGASKSFQGFLPISKQMWVPGTQQPNSILCTTIITKVNGVVRQKQPVCDMVYTPREMLCFIYEKFPNELPQKGDIVLTGTPGGVAFQVPAWKARLSAILNLDRFVKLGALIGSGGGNKKFLKPEDVVEVSGGMLDTVSVKITADLSSK